MGCGVLGFSASPRFTVMNDSIKERHPFPSNATRHNAARGLSASRELREGCRIGLQQGGPNGCGRRFILEPPRTGHVEWKKTGRFVIVGKSESICSAVWISLWSRSRRNQRWLSRQLRKGVAQPLDNIHVLISDSHVQDGFSCARERRRQKWAIICSRMIMIGLKYLHQQLYHAQGTLLDGIGQWSHAPRITA